MEGGPDARVRYSCGSCRHFDNAPASFERAFPGLLSFSSGSASVRGQDGICLLHERLVSARSGCKQHDTAKWSGPRPLLGPRPTE
jgi:hypothetical protein